MAVPKQKTSKSKRDKRRSHDALTTQSRSLCPNCGATRQPHRVCASCGHYRGRMIVETEEE
ncbi:MAG: 50S ribosomal protein L32 [bacterium]|nr:50S ribosomal protein L32 [bacterium]MCP5041904.1 50S ribosomal protein L32 [bacterium]